MSQSKLIRIDSARWRPCSADPLPRLGEKEVTTESSKGKKLLDEVNNNPATKAINSMSKEKLKKELNKKKERPF
jgi:hypothetical protein